MGLRQTHGAEALASHNLGHPLVSQLLTGTRVDQVCHALGNIEISPCKARVGCNKGYPGDRGDVKWQLQSPIVLHGWTGLLLIMNVQHLLRNAHIVKNQTQETLLAVLLNCLDLPFRVHHNVVLSIILGPCLVTRLV